VFFQASGPLSVLEKTRLGKAAHFDADFIRGGCRKLRQRHLRRSPHDYDLMLIEMLMHPTREILAEVTEVRRLVHAGGKAVQRDEQVCDELSHAKFPFTDFQLNTQHTFDRRPQ
jgi:hypothetical protein